MRIDQGLKLAATLLLTIVFSCSDKSTQPEQFELGQPIELRLGESATVHSVNLSVTFSRVSFDYRCSELRLCGWPGSSEIQLNVKTKSGESAMLDLALLGDAASDSSSYGLGFDTLGYHFELLSLLPKPISIHPVTHAVEGEATATIVVTYSSLWRSEFSGPTRISQVPFDSIPATRANILKGELMLDTLQVLVEVANPCTRHYFELNLDTIPELTDSLCTYRLWLRHTDKLVACTSATARHALSFDMLPIWNRIDSTIGLGKEKRLTLFRFNTMGNPDLNALTVSRWGRPDPQNVSPEFFEIGPISIRYGQRIEIDIQAIDANNSRLILWATGMPAHSSLRATGNGQARFTWIPQEDQVGDHSVDFIVSDGYLADSMNVSMTVQQNHAPLILDIEPTTVVDVSRGDTLAVIIHASDPDGDSLTYSISSSHPISQVRYTPLSSGLKVIVSSAGLPDTLIALQIEVNDGALADSAKVEFNVYNLAPVFSVSNTTMSISEGDSVILDLYAQDDNNDFLVYEVVESPRNLYWKRISSKHARIWFYPDYRQHGFYPFQVIVSDGRLNDKMLVIFVVEDKNAAPVLANVATQVCAPNQLFTLRLRAHDGDGDSLTFSMAGAPPGATLVPLTDSTAQFQYLGNEADIGEYMVDFVVSDNIAADSVAAQFAVLGSTPSQGSLIPFAQGTYWVYTSWDSISVIGAYTERDTTWWHLSREFGPLTKKIRIAGDTLFSTFGPELITPIDTAISYPVGSYHERTARILTEPVTVLAGTFTNCVEYTVNVKCAWSGYTAYYESYTIAPGVGIVKVFRFESECTLMSGRTRESELLRYHVASE